MMIKIYVYSCLLSALSIVEMKPLNITGRVGETLTVKCYDWNVWTDVEGNAKYFCNSPCKQNKHIIVTAAPGKTEQKKRIQIFNNKKTLHVTFIKLQKSDSKKYYCGVCRWITDPLIEVNLEVTDAESPSQQLQSTTSHFISDTSTSYIIYSTAATATTTTSTSSFTQGSGMVLYLIICVIVIITILMVLLTLIRKVTRKQLKKEGERVDVGEIRPGNGQSLNQPAVISTFYYSADGLYANYTELASESGNNCSKDFPLNAASSSGVNLKGTRAERRVVDPQCDIMYSVIQLPKKQTEPTVQSEPNQSEYNENDSLYSLAQLPKTN